MIFLFWGAIGGLAAPAIFVCMLHRIFLLYGRVGGARRFAAGAAAAFLALVIERQVWSWFDPILPFRWALMIRAFLMIGLVEEIAKIALIRGQVKDGEEITWRRFAILAAWVGAGFAGMENLLYIADIGISVLFTRIITATPFHVLNAVIAARIIWVGLCDKRDGFVLLSLMVATILHGLYDYLIFVDQIGSGKFLFALMITVSLGIYLLRRPDQILRIS